MISVELHRVEPDSTDMSLNPLGHCLCKRYREDGEAVAAIWVGCAHLDTGSLPLSVMRAWQRAIVPK